MIFIKISNSRNQKISFWYFEDYIHSYESIKFFRISRTPNEVFAPHIMENITPLTTEMYLYILYITRL
jgi:hypothetical protein